MQAVDLFRLERLGATKLPNAGQHPFELPKDEHGPLHTIRRPASHCFEISQYGIESITQIYDDVVAIHADAMPRVERSRRSTDQHRAGDELLQMALCRKQTFPIGLWLAVRHTRSLARSR